MQTAQVLAQARAEIRAALADGQWHRMSVQNRWGGQGLRAMREMLESGEVEKTGATTTLAYRLKAAPRPATPTASLKDTIVAIVAASGPMTEREVTAACRAALGRPVGGHEVQHLLYALRKQGVVEFRERVVGSHKRIPMVSLVAPKPVPAERVEAEQAAEEQDRAAALDALLEEAVTEPAPEEPEPAPEEPEPVPEYVDVAYADGARAAGVERYLGPNPVGFTDLSADEQAAVVDTMAREFPLLIALMTRPALIAEAARLLEKAGMEDEALRVLESKPPVTAVEEEYLRFATGMVVAPLMGPDPDDKRNVVMRLAVDG